MFAHLVCFVRHNHIVDSLHVAAIIAQTCKFSTEESCGIWNRHLSLTSMQLYWLVIVVQLTLTLLHGDNTDENAPSDLALNYPDKR